MAAAFVTRTQGGTVTGSTITLALPTIVTGDNIIVDCKAGTAVTVSSIALSTGTTSGFALKKAQANGTLPEEIWAAHVTAGGTTPTITVTFSAAPTGGEIVVYRFTGLDTSAATDGSNSATGSSTAPNSGSITPTANGEVLIGGCQVGSSSSAGTSGWTGAVTPNSNWSEYLIQATAGAASATFTSTNNTWTAIIVAFKLASTSVTFSATAQGKGSASAALLVTRGLTGTAQGKGSASAALSVTHKLTATAAGTGSASSALAVTRKLSVTAQGKGSASAALLVTRKLAATTQGFSQNTATLNQQGVSFSCTAKGTGSASAVLLVTRKLVGTLKGTGAATAALLVTRKLAGGNAGIGAASAALLVTRKLSGTAQGSSTGTSKLAPPLPVIVQHTSTAANKNVSYGAGTPNAGNNFLVNLPDPSKSGNCLILSVSNPYVSTYSLTITDDKSNTWSLVKTVNNGSIMSSVYVALNVTAGTRQVTVNFKNSGSNVNLYNCQFCLTEAYNIVSASAVDDSSSATISASGTIASGSLTTTAQNDLVYHYGFDASNTALASTGFTGMTAGSGFTFLSSDLMVGSFAQYKIATSAGSITPSATITGVTGDNWTTVAIALKAGAQGNPASSGIRVFAIHHVCYSHAGNIQIPTVGNLLYLATAAGVNNTNFTAISSSPTLTWNELPHPGSVGNGPPQCWYAAGVSSPSLESITVTGVTGTSNLESFLCYDIIGAATSPFDSSWNNSNSDVFESNGTFTLNTVTPSSTNGLVIAVVATYAGAITAESVGLFDTVTYSNIANGQFDADLIDNCDGYSHYYNATTSQVNFTFTESSTFGGGSTVFPTVAAFKSAGAAVTFSGTAQGKGSATAALSVTHKLAGTVQGKGSASCALQVTHKLSASSQGTGSAACALLVTHKLVAASQGTGAASSALLVTRKLAATAQGKGSASVTLNPQGVQFSGNARGTGSASCALSVTHKLAASVQGKGSATVALLVTRKLSATAEGFSQNSAKLSKAFSGTAQGTSTNSVTLRVTKTLSVTAQGHSLNAATLKIIRTLIGAAQGRSTSRVTLLIGTLHIVPLRNGAALTGVTTSKNIVAIKTDALTLVSITVVTG